MLYCDFVRGKIELKNQLQSADQRLPEVSQSITEQGKRLLLVQNMTDFVDSACGQELAM